MTKDIQKGPKSMKTRGRNSEDRNGSPPSKTPSEPVNSLGESPGKALHSQGYSRKLVGKGYICAR